MASKPHDRSVRNGGWVFVESTLGMYAERGAQRHRLCSTRVGREKALKLFREFVDMGAGASCQDEECE